MISHFLKSILIVVHLKIMNYDNILILNKVGKVSVNYKSIAKYTLIGFTILTFFRCLGLFYNITYKNTI